MRDATRAALGIRRADVLPLGSAHGGLYLERAAPWTDKEPRTPSEKDESQRRDREFRSELLRLGAPRFYRSVYERWVRALNLREGRSHVAVVEAASRLLVGHAEPSGTQVGLLLHPTYGIPYLRGTALKGLLNHYLAASGAEGWEGVRYGSKGPEAPPGVHHGAIFGAPALDPDHLDKRWNGARGGVVFEDALMLPPAGDGAALLAEDIVNPHQKRYYREYGAAPPNDWTAPVPVSFVTVRPGTRFLLAVSVDDEDKAVRDEVGPFVLGQLMEALDQWGIGGKTRAGYGRLVKADVEVAKPRAVVGPVRNENLRALEAAVKFVIEQSDPNGPPILERFKRHFEDDTLLDRVPAAFRGQALELVRPLIAHKGLRKRIGDRLDAIAKKLG